jgi:hypothetical protein
VISRAQDTNAPYSRRAPPRFQMLRFKLPEAITSTSSRDRRRIKPFYSVEAAHFSPDWRHDDWTGDRCDRFPGSLRNWERHATLVQGFLRETGLPKSDTRLLA